ncbi:MAG TPA: rRNA maturation RNase YbeY [Candidatus Cloacimonetes bacterium]|nr:rRNA maturation RNase YbeY [Candidatus Cloacimonadota bacterium]
MIKIAIEGELPAGISPSEISTLAKHIMGRECPDKAFEISLNIVDSDEMRKINRQYRGADETTDILSFVSDELDLNGRKSHICDIIVDINSLEIQKGINSLIEEFWQVLIHGLLHLAGYDHITHADRKKMEDAEEKYNSQLLGVLNGGR